MHQNNMRKKQVAVVTGASGGFGSEIVSSLLEAGFYVAATDISAERNDDLKRRMNSNERLATFVMDVTDIDSIISAKDQIINYYNIQICILINNAGIYANNYLLSEKRNENSDIVNKVIDINLTGAFNCTMIFSRVMAENNFGRIINIASVAGISGAALASAYAASKAGLICLTESWSREMASKNINVYAIAPGPSSTPMHDGRSNGLAERLYEVLVPVGRAGNPKDISEVVTFLSTSESNYLNSTVINVDGGIRVGF